MNILGIMMVTGIGILFIAIYANGASLSTTPQLNKLETFDISVTSSETLIEMDLGTASIIDSVSLTFRNDLVDNTTVSISIKNSTGTEIGSGSKVVSPASSVVTINLTDTITANERPDVRSLSITA
ncbi:MAG: hypothetical protein COA77_06855 [Thaumarchaeota archaeon]|nr:MAG: hypothetical protein COA77_06855 [Nitrososphaerota archaeon]